LFHDLAPGFNLPVDEMILMEQDEQTACEAKEWAESAGLIDGLIAPQEAAAPLLPIPQPAVPTKTAEDCKGCKRSTSKVTACIREMIQQDWFPRVNPAGIVCCCPEEGCLGKQAMNNC
jgi:hypothetical protein